jgi:protein-S-isoprenylcysteine O-methyltransferase Ste14
MISHYLFEFPWIVFATYWAIGALRTRATVRREPFLARYGVMFIEVVGFTLLFSHDADIGFLGRHFAPRTMTMQAIGLAFTWAGIALAVWARYHLGQYWSGRITLKEGHELICTGPYARLRHPIYTGLDMAAIGSALFLDRWRCLFGVCIIMIGFVIKAKREEALLAGQFGEAFKKHMQHTGFLLPRLKNTY